MLERRVRADGVVLRDPQAPVFPGRTVLTVDGHEVTAAPRVYVMLNKPRGLITSAADDQGRGGSNNQFFHRLSPEIGGMGGRGGKRRC